MFIGITSPLSWAATPLLPPPAAGDDSDGEAEPGGSGEAAAAGSGEEACAAARHQQQQAAYSERDAPTRQPAACAAACHRAEHAVLSAARPGRLATHVVLPGIMYGAGEDDAHLHSFFQAAWEARPGGRLVQVGAGANRIPTLHVAALAAYVAGALEASAAALSLAAQAAAAKGPLARRALQASLTASAAAAGGLGGTSGGAAVSAGVHSLQRTATPERAGAAVPAYLLVADESPVTQAQLLAGVAGAFGGRLAPAIVRVTPEQALVGGFDGAADDCGSGGSEFSSERSGAAAPAAEAQRRRAIEQAQLALSTLDLPLRTTPLPGGAALCPGPRTPGGLIDALDSVVAELLAARGLAPLRLLLRGPPGAGKSHLGARLAAAYGLPLISAGAILAEAAHCDGELQKVRGGCPGIFQK